jgi:hypothetical protein
MIMMYILANLQSGENRRMHIKYYSNIQPLQLGYMSITTNGIGTDLIGTDLYYQRLSRMLN